MSTVHQTKEKQNIIIEKKIGRGSYAIVYKGKIKSTGQVCAIKVIDLSQRNINLRHIKREIKLMESMDHPNIVKLYEAYRIKNHLYLVMEYCDRGDLEKEIETRSHFDESSAKKIFFQIVSALKYMHGKSLIHRDIKPQNILLCSPKCKTKKREKQKNNKNEEKNNFEDDLIVKIADFGLAREAPNNAVDLKYTKCGTPLYMAPEILGGKNYSPKVDIWSSGAVLYQMLTGKAPFIAFDINDLKQQYFEYDLNKKSQTFPKNIKISRKAKHYINSMLQINPINRISFENFVNHEFLKGALIVEKKIKMEDENQTFNITNDNDQDDYKNKNKNKNINENKNENEKLKQIKLTQELKNFLKVLRTLKPKTLTYQLYQMQSRINAVKIFADQISEDDQSKGLVLYIKISKFLLLYIEKVNSFILKFDFEENQKRAICEQMSALKRLSNTCYENVKNKGNIVKLMNALKFVDMKVISPRKLIYERAFHLLIQLKHHENFIFFKKNEQSFQSVKYLFEFLLLDEDFNSRDLLTIYKLYLEIPSTENKLMSENSLVLKCVLEGHNGWVTSIATTPENPNMFVTSSRDKTLLVWNINEEQVSGYQEDYAYPVKSLHGHSHFVEDVTISSDGMFALSGSWDKTLRLWDLTTGKCTQQFIGHTGDVLSVTFSAENRQILSSSRDKTVRLWNTLGKCKYVIEDKSSHNDWVSSVRFSPLLKSTTFVSSSWDKTVKMWNLNGCKLEKNLYGHTEQVNCVEMSPDGSLCASGGKDGKAILWDLEKQAGLKVLDVGEEVNALSFSPNRFWLATASRNGIKIWQLQKDYLLAELNDTFKVGKKGIKPRPISLAWSHDGNTLFVGYTDNKIRVWAVESEDEKQQVDINIDDEEEEEEEEYEENEEN
ncbi:receptor for activated protein kinase c rack1 [Anaeramoeba flamelloides]|uniref:Receptor for activated protein kinase c rack1 n=1 Tax=Anaeramoeba flamelloides TaxID=1746091 RepID=A0AAV8AE34_9EUKA|nr:receptor for activated protein kinase c rack1 [Anaeramoeba flamelloides]